MPLNVYVMPLVLYFAARVEHTSLSADEEQHASTSYQQAEERVKDIQESLTGRLLDKAHRTGAEAIVVSCPLCQANLDMIQTGGRPYRLPVFYFTELLRLALAGDGRAGSWFRKHVTDPVELLRAKGLIA